MPKKAKKAAKEAAKNNTADPVRMTTDMKGEPEGTEQKDITFIEMDPEPDPSLPRAIILDLSPVNFLDTVGVKTLRRIWTDYGGNWFKGGSRLLPTGVVDSLQAGGFFNDKVTKSCLFSSIHDAVLHCQSSGR
ncbi:Prestin, partial [Nibea albiflora]